MSTPADIVDGGRMTPQLQRLAAMLNRPLDFDPYLLAWVCSNAGTRQALFALAYRSQAWSGLAEVATCALTARYSLSKDGPLEVAGIAAHMLGNPEARDASWRQLGAGHSLQAGAGAAPGAVTLSLWALAQEPLEGILTVDFDPALIEVLRCDDPDVHDADAPHALGPVQPFTVVGLDRHNGLRQSQTWAADARAALRELAAQEPDTLLLLAINGWTQLRSHRDAGRAVRASLIPATPHIAGDPLTGPFTCVLLTATGMVQAYQASGVSAQEAIRDGRWSSAEDDDLVVGVLYGDCHELETPTDTCEAVLGSQLLDPPTPTEPSTTREEGITR